MSMKVYPPLDPNQNFVACGRCGLDVRLHLRWDTDTETWDMAPGFSKCKSASQTIDINDILFDLALIELRKVLK